MAQGYGEHYLPVNFPAPDSNATISKCKAGKVKLSDNPSIHDGSEFQAVVEVIGLPLYQ